MTVAAEAWLRMRKQADAAQMEIMLRMESCKIQKAKLLREMAQQYQGGPFEQTLNACAAQIIAAVRSFRCRSPPMFCTRREKSAMRSGSQRIMSGGSQTNTA